MCVSRTAYILVPNQYFKKYATDILFIEFAKLCFVYK